MQIYKWWVEVYLKGFNFKDIYEDAEHEPVLLEQNKLQNTQTIWWVLIMTNFDNHIYKYDYSIEIITKYTIETKTRTFTYFYIFI